MTLVQASGAVGFSGEGTTAAPEDLPARFMAKVRVSDNGCWLWTGATRSGYGAFWLGPPARKVARAHRFAYELTVGPVPDGRVLDHTCRVPACVNPRHLEAVTQRENALRGDTIAARNAAKTHCLHGHAYDLFNTAFRPNNNARYCRACRRAA